MKDVAGEVNARIATRVRAMREERGLSLETLAGASGVSRSMISLIERNETSPTATVLDRLAAGFGVSLASLFGVDDTSRTETGPIARKSQQTEWRDPASGYVRRTISPPSPAQPFQISEVVFPAGASVIFESPARSTLVHQQVWMLEGAMDVSVGAERHSLRAGDCLAMTVERQTSFHNPGRKTARYAVVTSSTLSRATP